MTDKTHSIILAISEKRTYEGQIRTRDVESIELMNPVW